MKFRTKGFTSLLLACCFAVAGISGVVLYVTPKGRVANWTNWNMLGLDKHEWGAVHINVCLLLLIIGGVHLVLNWRIFLSYIKRKAAGLNLKVEMAAAVLITTGIVAGTLFQVPPLTSTMTLNEKIKAYWEQRAPSGPAPHAEEFSVVRFAGNVGLSVDDVTTALRQEGFAVEDPEVSIGELAKQNGIAPSDVYLAVKKHFPEATGDLHAGEGRGLGLGLGQGGSGGAQTGQARGKTKDRVDAKDRARGWDWARVEAAGTAIGNHAKIHPVANIDNREEYH